MSLSSARQRRPTAASPQPDEGYSKDAKDSRRTPGADEEGIKWFLPFLALGLLRHMSASSNLIHDCDEVFSYWEPLHFLLYRSGFQTWEYR
jgi:alpha-1,2-mannosyltransferase